jgi:hypothetical protein
VPPTPPALPVDPLAPPVPADEADEVEAAPEAEVDVDVEVVGSSLHPANRAKDEAAETMVKASANLVLIRNLFELA